MMHVSIVINTLDRALNLRQTLCALKYLDYPNFEVIVVNGPSTDNTQDILKQYDQYIKIAECPQKNLSMSRNIGIALAAGDVVAFLDDDAIPESQWLTNLIKGYDSDEIAGVGGPLYDNTGCKFQVQYSLANRLTLARQLDNKFIGNTLFTDESFCFPGAFEFVSMVGANSSFRREKLLEVGGFDEQYDYFLDETDVCLRLIDEGYIIKNVKDAYVHHKFAPSYVRKPKAFTNFYHILKNMIYYIHKNYFPYFDDKAKALEVIHHFIAQKKNETLCNYQEGRLNENEYKIAIESLYSGLNQGFLDAEKSARSLLSTTTLKNYQANYKQYVTENKRLVICFLASNYLSYESDHTAKFIQELARRFAGLGHHVHVIHQSATEQSTVDFVDGVWLHAISGYEEDITKKQFDEVEKIKQRYGRVDILRLDSCECGDRAFIFDDYFKTKLVASLRELEESLLAREHIYAWEQ